MSEEWQVISHNQLNTFSRLKVDGGYLYRNINYTQDKYNMESGSSQSMCFVPDIDLQRYEAHLRDAYKKGYDQGLYDGKHGLDDPSSLAL